MERSIDYQKGYEAGRKVGHAEGMIFYQRHVINNLNKDSEKLVKQLNKAMEGKS